MGGQGESALQSLTTVNLGAVDNLSTGGIQSMVEGGIPTTINTSMQ